MTKILEMKSVDELRRLKARDTAFIKFGEKEITHVLKLCDALWLHSGDPKDPHAELTAGDCSNGFVDTLRALRYSNLCQIFGELASYKYEELCEWREQNKRVDWVVGSDHAGADFSHSVAIAMGAQHDFTEKGPESLSCGKDSPLGQTKLSCRQKS